MSDDVRDSIGSSVFSKTFVVNTLHSTLESAKNKLNSCTKRGFDLPRIDDFTDLCHLWDISSNYDVCKFLKDSGNLEDIEILLSLGLSARLNEILFGIVGNMACYPEFVDEIYRSISLKDHIDNCLIYVDAEMIHQLLRIVYAFCRTNDSSGQKELLVKHLKEPLIYILKNSSNQNLIRIAFKTLSCIYQVIENDAALNESIICGLIEISCTLDDFAEFCFILTDCSWEINDENREQYLNNTNKLLSKIIEYFRDTKADEQAKFKYLLDISSDFLKARYDCYLPKDEKMEELYQDNLLRITNTVLKTIGSMSCPKEEIKGFSELLLVKLLPNLKKIIISR